MSADLAKRPRGFSPPSRAGGGASLQFHRRDTALGLIVSQVHATLRPAVSTPLHPPSNAFPHPPPPQPSPRLGHFAHNFKFLQEFGAVPPGLRVSTSSSLKLALRNQRPGSRSSPIHSELLLLGQVPSLPGTPQL